MDRYFHWRECLRTSALASTDEPCLGFWRRTLFRGSRYQPIAIFERDGEIVCVADEAEVPAHKVWTPFMQPISEETYRLARAEGRFRDEFSSRDGSLTTDLREAVAVLPPIKEHRNGNGRPHSAEE